MTEKPEMIGDKDKSPWNYRQPKYDDRSSCYYNAGTDHGVGKRNPVGHQSDPKTRVPTLPFGAKSEKA